MAVDFANTAPALENVPAYQRDRILSGMRWSVWLSGLAILSGLATNLLLAHAGPKTIGCYGLLSVYIYLVSSFLYFGGDPVLVKFFPECRAKDRTTFLISYLALVFFFFMSVLVLTYCFPQLLRITLGHDTSDWHNFVLLCFAPVPIGFFAIVAALRGMLEISFAQMLAKLIAFLTFAAYGFVYLAHPRLLQNYPTPTVFGIYFAAAAAVAVAGAVRLARLCGLPGRRFYLPNGFWRYTFDLQQVSVVAFFSSRIDYVLILNIGGLAVLGKYVAIMAVAGAIPTINRPIADTLLPSLTNMLAADNEQGAAQVFMIHMRIVFLATVTVSSAMMVLAEPATRLMGARYHSLECAIIGMVMLEGIASPGAFGGTLLTSIGRQRLALWAGFLNVVVFSSLFFVLWHFWNLTGAVVAHGSALIMSNGILMLLALRASGVFPSVLSLWTKSALVLAGEGVVTLFCYPLGVVNATLVLVSAPTIFLLSAQYKAGELKMLAATFIPGKDQLNRIQS